MMYYNFLDNTQKRTIHTCNYNQHTHAAHPDRIMGQHDLIYIREGNWQISQDGVDYDLTAGDVILLQGNHHHYGRIPCETTVKTCFIHFSLHESDRVAENADFSGWAFPMVVHCRNNRMVEHYFDRVVYSYWSDDVHANRKASAYLDLLLCELASAQEERPVHYSMVDDIKVQIKRTPNRFIAIEEFAARYHCSARTVSAKFKASTGCSLHAWQMRLKCQMADELMKTDSSLTLKEIAGIYGFYDEYHFGKCFKKIMGRSPKRAKT